MAWHANAPTEEQAKKFLLDLVRQVGRGFIQCSHIDKAIRYSETEVVRGRPLVEGMTIELKFDIFYRPKAVVST